MKRLTPSQRGARTALWDTRDEVARCYLTHQNCLRIQAAQAVCERAGWPWERYLVAAVFDCPELLEEA